MLSIFSTFKVKYCFNLEIECCQLFKDKFNKFVLLAILSIDMRRMKSNENVLHCSIFTTLKYFVPY